MGATSPGKQIRNHEPADSPVYPDNYAVTYTQIAESLASHFDLIYYISCDNSNYVELSTRKKSGELKVQDQGNDFFAASQSNLDRLIDSEDRDRLRLFLDRDRLISRLGGYIRIRHENGQRLIDYIESYSHTNDQVIRFGENILDLIQEVDCDSLATVIVPLGKRDEETDERLTIKSVNLKCGLSLTERMVRNG